jgi:hypothetical protein
MFAATDADELKVERLRAGALALRGASAGTDVDLRPDARADVAVADCCRHDCKGRRPGKTCPAGINPNRGASSDWRGATGSPNVYELGGTRTPKIAPMLGAKDKSPVKELTGLCL